MAIMTITWHTHLDERTCPVCAPLDGKEYVFHTSGVFPAVLRDGSGRVVWDCLRDIPMTHGEASRAGPWNCRCWLTWEFDLSDLIEQERRIREELIQPLLEASKS